jgi:uncharacterized repeat protein (TIGR01451 family)
VFGFSVIFYSFPVKSQASSLSGTGIGIRKDGPLKAKTGETIEYTITVYNLGDYWIRNITVTDIFPNGISSSWAIPDLAPLDQTGDSFTISGILYTIQNGDVLAGPPSHIQNHAEVTGYVDIEGLSKPVYASTDYPTLIIKPPVACFTVSDDNPQVCQTITFNASCSYDPDGWIVKYEWDWEGDGIYDFGAGNDPIATHHYPQYGVYYPKLRVTDNDNLTNETMRRVVVYAPVVGGYSVQIKTTDPSTTYTIYIILLFIMSAIFTRVRSQIKRTLHTI